MRELGKVGAVEEGGREGKVELPGVKDRRKKGVERDDRN